MAVRQATQQEIDGWISAVALYEQHRLPADHPRHLRYGGGALAEVKREAQRCRNLLITRGLLPTEDAIKKLAWGDVDMDAVRAKKAAEKEHHDLWCLVRGAADNATTEQLRAALVALGRIGS